MNELTLTVFEPIRLLIEPAPAGTCIVTMVYQDFVASARGFEMAYTLPADKMIAVRVDYVDAGGHPATVDGPVTWDTSAGTIVSVDADNGDSQQCTITPAGTLGTAQVTATADADIGTGTRTLVTTLDVTIVAGEAVAGVISPVGEPQPIS